MERPGSARSCSLVLHWQNLPGFKKTWRGLEQTPCSALPEVMLEAGTPAKSLCTQF